MESGLHRVYAGRMANGAHKHTLTITLDDETAARLESAALEAGLEPEAYLNGMVMDGLADIDPIPESARRFQQEQAELALANYDRTGISFPLEDVLEEFTRRVESRLAERG